jgi:hypothetical protein
MMNEGDQWSRVARVFFVKTYQNGKNIPNDHKLHIPNGHKLYQMAVSIPNGHKI